MNEQSNELVKRMHDACDMVDIPRHTDNGTEIAAEHRVFAMALALKGRIDTAEVQSLREEGIRKAFNDSKRLSELRALLVAQERQETDRVDYTLLIRECLKQNVGVD